MSKSNSIAMEPFIVTETSVSRAYAKILLRVTQGSGKEVSPLVLSISEFESEDNRLRDALDILLQSKGKCVVEDVAYTIFPERLWLMAQGDRAKLFSFYKMAFPAYQAMNRTANGRGLYFERMMMYGRGPCDGNQLEYVISQYDGRDGVRDSMMQVTTFDPERDHTPSAQLGFPCLQHVTFVPTKSGLVLNAFYATQQIFDKAYGNYLGLKQLGEFMAFQLKMPFVRLNVTVGVAKLERISKTDAGLKPVIAAAEAAISETQELGTAGQNLHFAATAN
ncbi:thymidylate synthase [uncultured Agrobacterium sp.]|uniref:thymidylate synthase n=1 Tax=uncultured Agrobacterium sp. TaxID=157277 RepID=UPI0025D4E5D8|nr:thymidylate synthase [uncultured Agrobacterium sp.]